MAATLGWDDGLATAFAAFDPTSHHARVARVDRTAVDLLVPGDEPGSRRAGLRVHDLAPVVGDWAVVTADGAGWRVDALLPRRTTIQRAAPSARSESQVLAANVDAVLVVMPAVPEPKPALVERLVALSWDSGATPIVVLTKADLTSDVEAIAADLAEAAPGVDVVAVSVVREDGFAALMPHLTEGRTFCLIGRSGAGKSSLVNALLDTEVLATQEVRNDGKGRHTTTHRELLVLPSGAIVIDTPGLRGAGLWVTDEGLDRTFADIDALVGECRFTDCEHRTEPGCAVLLAVDEGRLPQRRLDSWHKLQREARWMASRTDARLRSEARRAWVIQHKELRRSGRTRP